MRKGAIFAGVLGGQAIDPVSQGLLLQQAALALQMAHLNSPQAAASHDQEAASAVALHAALRAQQGEGNTFSYKVLGLEVVLQINDINRGRIPPWPACRSAHTAR